MDRGRLEELKRLLDERHNNAKQNLDRELDAENSNAQNSDTSNLNASNFDLSDLNNTTLFKNSNARNYDKDPIIIKNYEKFFVYAHLLVFLQVSGLLISFIWDIVDFGHIYICRRLFRSLYNDITDRRYYLYLYRNTQ